MAKSTNHEAPRYAVFPTPPVTSSLFGPNILHSTLFSNTLSLCSSPNVRDQALHPYRTTGKIIVFHIIIFTFLGGGGGGNSNRSSSNEDNSVLSCK
jgi:hypothetical protein